VGPGLTAGGGDEWGTSSNCVACRGTTGGALCRDLVRGCRDVVRGCRDLVSGCRDLVSGCRDWVSGCLDLVQWVPDSGQVGAGTE
jgi:hypothetical protein